MTEQKPKVRLGRGLSALLSEHLESAEGQEELQARMVPVRSVVPNPFQPRREFRPEELEDLERSIAENGLLQPLVVRPAPAAPGKYELVAGERRLRCVSRLGWAEVPVNVREVEDTTLLVLALVENIQRSQLSPLEEAEGFHTLAEEFGLSQSEIAKAVGKSRPAVANALRLLQLPPSVRRLLANGQLSAGHARALLALEDELVIGDLARRAAEEGWSVREVESRVRKGGISAGKPGKSGRSRSGGKIEDPVVSALQETLRETFGTRVHLRSGKSGSGSVEIPFGDPEEFERIFQLLTGSPPSAFLD